MLVLGRCGWSLALEARKPPSAMQPGTWSLSLLPFASIQTEGHTKIYDMAVKMKSCCTRACPLCNHQTCMAHARVIPFREKHHRWGPLAKDVVGCCCSVAVRQIRPSHTQNYTCMIYSVENEAREITLLWFGSFYLKLGQARLLICCTLQSFHYDFVSVVGLKICSKATE